VVILKPKIPDYPIAKAYRVIILLNCLGKVVEKVAANTIAEECECKRLLHNEQFGCRKRRLAIHAVGRLMMTVEELWKKREYRGSTVNGYQGSLPACGEGELNKKNGRDGI